MDTDLKLLASKRTVILNEGALPELDELARKATVLGLGESVHGCGTFHRVNYNLARYLITHHGFRIFQLEVPSVGSTLSRHLLTAELKIQPHG
jgi:erythromycin esterase-like protein